MQPIATMKSIWPPGAADKDPFQQFFRQFSPDRFPDAAADSRDVGSGFIVRPDGYILTDARLVANAKQVTVKLTDRREFKASIVGIDRPSGIALLKVNARNLPTVKIGRPAAMKSGQWVVAIGTPYGFENTVNGIAGVVASGIRVFSAWGRARR